MGITSRHYIFAADGSLRRIPRRVLDRLGFGEDAIPEFANSRQKIGAALIRYDDQKPVALLDLQGFYWVFDEEGKIDKHISSSLQKIMEFGFDAPDPGGKVVDLTPAIKKRQYNDRHRWEPTKDDWDRVALDIWPGLNGAAADVQIVKGKTPKRPPLTWEAKEALKAVRDAFFKIQLALGDLSEPALKGLAFELRRTGTYEREAPMWNGVAAEADRLYEISRRQRTGQGVWYAVVEAVTDDAVRKHYADLHVLAHEECPNKKTAVSAARRLLKEHADAFSGDTTVEASVRSELEWTPADG